jgi:hypothetical protein
MVIDTLTEMVGLLVALSAASERLVDIVKGFIGRLQKPDPSATVDPRQEGRRKAMIQLMAVFAGFLTTLLAWPIVGDMFPGTTGNNALVVIGLGFLVSGGSGLWNSILSYLLAIKDVKKKEAPNP